jgi:mono/diheme cytochrome c family protein
MKFKLKAVCFMFVMVAAGLVSGCGSSGGGAAFDSGTASPSAASPSGSISTSTPASTVDGAALYGTNCAGCHGALATSTKKGATAAQIQIRMYTTPYSNSTLTAGEVQAIADALSLTQPTTTTPTQGVDGAALYAANCASCHGALATSAKKGVTAAQIQVRMSNTPYSTRTLTAAEVQAIAAALAVAPPTTTTPPPTTTTPPPTTTTPPPATTVDGASLYAANCAGCHGALATSAKMGATAAQIQVRMSTTPYTSRTLTTAEIQAIATALAATPPTTTTPPPTTAACGSCHTTPPATGKHSYHSSRATCATCHGSGYSTTTFVAATHNNGVKNLTTTIGWNATSRSCSNSCHGSKRW